MRLKRLAKLQSAPQASTPGPSTSATTTAPPVQIQKSSPVAPIRASRPITITPAHAPPVKKRAVEFDLVKWEKDAVENVFDIALDVRHAFELERLHLLTIS